MATYEVEMKDGRHLEVEADAPPTEEEVYAHLRSQQHPATSEEFAPKVDVKGQIASGVGAGVGPGPNTVDFVKNLGKGTVNLVKGLPGAVMNMTPESVGKGLEHRVGEYKNDPLGTIYNDPASFLMDAGAAVEGGAGAVRGAVAAGRGIARTAGAAARSPIVQGAKAAGMGAIEDIPVVRGAIKGVRDFNKGRAAAMPKPSTAAEGWDPYMANKGGPASGAEVASNRIPYGPMDEAGAAHSTNTGGRLAGQAPSLDDALNDALNQQLGPDPAKKVTGAPEPGITSSGREGEFQSSGRPAVSGGRYDSLVPKADQVERMSQQYDRVPKPGEAVDEAGRPLGGTMGEEPYMRQAREVAAPADTDMRSGVGGSFTPDAQTELMNNMTKDPASTSPELIEKFRTQPGQSKPDVRAGDEGFVDPLVGGGDEFGAGEAADREAADAQGPAMPRGGKKPGIHVISDPASDSFDWLSDGWNSQDMGTRGTPEAQSLMDKVNQIVSDAANHDEAVQRLKDAGFDVSYAEQAADAAGPAQSKFSPKPDEYPEGMDPSDYADYDEEWNDTGYSNMDNNRMLFQSDVNRIPSDSVFKNPHTEETGITKTFGSRKQNAPIEDVIPTQPELSQDVINEYADGIDDYNTLPDGSKELATRSDAVRGPDGKFYLGDGHHRAAAHIQAGRNLIPVDAAEADSYTGRLMGDDPNTPEEWHSGAEPGTPEAKQASQLHKDDYLMDQIYRQLLDDPRK